MDYFIEDPKKGMVLRLWNPDSLWGGFYFHASF